MGPEVSQLAPDFSLPDQDGKSRKLSDFKGSWVLLYFYPRDFTPGCTKEACGIRDNFASFEKIGAKVLGVSKDSVESHKKFSQKHQLPFTLLADPEKKVLKLYGVWQKKKMMGKEYFGTARTSFLIGPKGKIAKVYQNVTPPIHAKQILQDLLEFKQ